MSLAALGRSRFAIGCKVAEVSKRRSSRTSRSGRRFVRRPVRPSIPRCAVPPGSALPEFGPTCHASCGSILTASTPSESALTRRGAPT